jgi:hypothetical protein
LVERVMTERPGYCSYMPGFNLLGLQISAPIPIEATAKPLEILEPPDAPSPQSNLDPGRICPEAPGLRNLISIRC